jgi:uncharacterized protein (TIGR02145 family)
MKKIYTFILALVVSASLWAQAPQKFSYQAVVRGANNDLLANKPVGMKISLLQVTETGTAVYVETQTPTSNANGLVSIAIGGGTKVSGDFATIDWANGPYFVKTETDPAGGTSYSLTTTSQLLSVPYALNSKESGNGIKSVSLTGDTLFLTNGNFLIIPGISLSNHKPTNGYGLNITDVEGNSYKTVYIGTQTWMAENLKASKYNDGTDIPNITDNTQWSNLTTGAWAYYNNDVANNAKYGKLYNWYAVSPTTNGNKNVCPTGWHVPSDAEWTVLTDYLGGLNVAGGKIKEAGIINWFNPNNEASNITLFTAVPGGFRDNGGNSNFIGAHCYIWSSSNATLSTAFERELSYGNGSLIKTDTSKKYGFTVR